jgi:hypothetical protein
VTNGSLMRYPLLAATLAAAACGCWIASRSPMFEQWKITNDWFGLWVLVKIAQWVLAATTVLALARLVNDLVRTAVARSERLDRVATRVGIMGATTLRHLRLVVPPVLVVGAVFMAPRSSFFMYFVYVLLAWVAAWHIMPKAHRVPLMLGAALAYYTRLLFGWR